MNSVDIQIPTLLSAMVARFDARDLDGAERCFREAKARGVTDEQLGEAWRQSKVLELNLSNEDLARFDLVF